jgi:hypothetical protein
LEPNSTETAAKEANNPLGLPAVLANRLPTRTSWHAVSMPSTVYAVHENSLYVVRAEKGGDHHEQEHTLKRHGLEDLDLKLTERITNSGLPGKRNERTSTLMDFDQHNNKVLESARISTTATATPPTRICSSPSC